MSRRARRRSESGFLLLDALVAFAVLATALTLLLRSEVGTARALAEAAESYAATEVARSKLEEIGLSIPLEPGLVRGEVGEWWGWEARIEIRELDPRLRYAALVAEASVSITVRHLGDERPLATLRTLRLVPREG